MMIRILLMLCCVVAVHAGDAPTASEWNPLATMIADNPQAAIAGVRALSAKYPTWSDGSRALALALARKEQWKEAYLAAAAAFKAQPTDAISGEIAVLAAARLNNLDVATKAAAMFNASIDANGRIAYRLAMAQLAAKQYPAAKLSIDQAIERAGNKAVAEFFNAKAQIATASGDLEAAEAALARSVAIQPQQSDVWYALGLARLRFAQKAIAPADGRWLQAAGDAFRGGIASNPTDADSLSGLGKTLLETSKRAKALNNGSPYSTTLNEAITYLKRALDAKPDLVAARLFIGEAYLRRGEDTADSQDYAEAAKHLAFAVDNGCTGRDIRELLMNAYARSGQSAKAESIAQQIIPTTTGERISLGLTNLKTGNYAMAGTLLTAAAADESQDIVQRGRIWRSAGHAYRHLADSALGADGKASAGSTAQRQAALDKARDAYAASGDCGDYEGQRWFLVSEGARGAEQAYAAADRALGWSMFSVSAWATKIANYPQAASGGAGFSGWWQRHPVHVCLWLAAIIACVVLGVLAMRRKSSVSVDAAQGNADQSPQAKPATKPTAPKPITGRETQPAAGVRASSSTARPATPKPVTKPPAPRNAAIRASSLTRLPPKPPARGGDVTQPIQPPDQG